MNHQRKPAICYGAFVNLERIENLNLYADKMAVTSFTSRNGTIMAHGRGIPDGIPSHRKASGMLFWYSEDRMNLAIERAFTLASQYDEAIEVKRKELNEVIRQRQISCEGALNRHAYDPTDTYFA